jgi:hypothetical protein
MPGLIKVGHSTKDPELRARELNNTGNPHSYIVEYEMLIENPARVEQQAHKALLSLRAGREWFQCSCEEAVAAIQHVATGRAINEVFKRADRERAVRIRKDREEAEKRNELISSKTSTQELGVQLKYGDLLASRFQPIPFWQYWIGCSVGLFVLSGAAFPKISDLGAIFLSSISGAVVASFVKDYWEARRKRLPEYQALIKERDAQIKEAREAIIVVCPRRSCQQKIRFEVIKLKSVSKGMWHCPQCKTIIDLWRDERIIRLIHD